MLNDYNYEAEMECTRLRSRVKQLEKTVQDWALRIAKIEENQNLMTISYERRISTLESKVLRLKAKLKKSKSRIFTLELQQGNGELSWYDYNADSQQETEVSELDCNGDGSQTDSGTVVNDGSGESAKENLGLEVTESPKKKRKRKDRDSSSMRPKNINVDVPQENHSATVGVVTKRGVQPLGNPDDDNGSRIQEKDNYYDYYQYEGEDEMTASASSSPRVSRSASKLSKSSGLTNGHSGQEPLDTTASLDQQLRVRFADETNCDEMEDEGHDDFEGESQGDEELGEDYMDQDEEYDEFEDGGCETNEAETHDSEDDDNVLEEFGEGSAECFLCLELFPTQADVEKHLLEAHQEPAADESQNLKKDLFACSKCEKTFKKQKHLDKHMKRHTEDGLATTANESDMTTSSSVPAEATTSAIINDTEMPSTSASAAMKTAQLPAPENPSYPLECTSCKNKFYSITKLAAHNDGKTVFNCRGKCKASFGCREGLRQHIMSCPDYGGSKCDACGKVLADDYSLRKHERTVHSRVSCPKCRKPFGKYGANSLREHMKKCDLYCKPCDKTFARTQGLQRHMKEKHTVDELPKLTKSGRKRLPTKKPKSPNASKQESPEKQVAPRSSPRTPSKNPEVISLEEEVPATPQRVSVSLNSLKNIPECSACGKTYSSHHSLQRHMETHKVQYVCSLCKETLTGWSDLVQHVEAAHPESKGTEKRILAYERGRASVKKLICSMCPMEFTAKDQLLKHFCSTHAWLKPYRCGKCDKSFPSPVHLKRHESQH